MTARSKGERAKNDAILGALALAASASLRRHLARRKVRSQVSWQALCGFYAACVRAPAALRRRGLTTWMRPRELATK